MTEPDDKVLDETKDGVSDDTKAGVLDDTKDGQGTGETIADLKARLAQATADRKKWKEAARANQDAADKLQAREDAELSAAEKLQKQLNEALPFVKQAKEQDDVFKALVEAKIDKVPEKYRSLVTGTPAQQFKIVSTLIDGAATQAAEDGSGEGGKKPVPPSIGDVLPGKSTGKVIKESDWVALPQPQFKAIKDAELRGEVTILYGQ
jgi:hypothetical protein